MKTIQQARSRYNELGNDTKLMIETANPKRERKTQEIPPVTLSEVSKANTLNTVLARIAEILKKDRHAVGVEKAVCNLNIGRGETAQIFLKAALYSDEVLEHRRNCSGLIIREMEAEQEVKAREAFVCFIDLTMKGREFTRDQQKYLNRFMRHMGW